MTHQVAVPITHDFVRDEIRIGEPDVCGPLAVFPLFGPEPEIEYLSFAQAVGLGVSVKELDGRAEVNDLVVTNPTDKNVLLYEGEEVLGAQQNRTFDVSVLVAAGTRLTVPVSCVEAGRWQGARHGEDFVPAPQAAYPELRKLKNRQARMASAAGMEARAVQGAVWSEIASKSARLAVDSQTDAMHDIYESRRDRLADFRRAIHHRPGQIGALVCINGRPSVIDHVSRPDVFAALHGPLVQGYALDALESVANDGARFEPDVAQAFLDAALGARVSERDGIGMGREIRFTDREVGGAGLVVGKELVQLTAFAEDVEQPGPGVPHSHRACIRRPSMRRNA